jgi:hypothetical protein
MYMKWLILALVAAISLQNTCPNGWAEKTAFATCGQTQQTSNCHLHGQKKQDQSESADAKRELSGVKQHFVLHIAEPDNAYQLLDCVNSPILADFSTMTEIFPDPPVRPPINGRFA